MLHNHARIRKIDIPVNEKSDRSVKVRVIQSGLQTLAN
jgi:hypothetical protein